MAREESPLSLPPEEMRALGYRVVDLLVDRWEKLDQVDPWRMLDRAALEARLREDPPLEPGDPEQVLTRAVDDVLEWAARVDHPRFMAFIPGGPTWPGVLADLLSAGFNTFQGTWLGSSGPSQVELVVLDWIREWLGLGREWGGLLTSGGSAANLIALAAAREALRSQAPDGPPGALYLGDQGHSSLVKAAVTVGIPRGLIRTVPSDGAFRLDPSALEGIMEEDRQAGIPAVAVCAAAGATNTGAVDDLERIGEIARSHGTWFHVDAAYGGFGVLDSRGRVSYPGLERADSVTLDPHKWLYQPFETGCVLVRDPGVLHRAFRISAEYLQDTELGSAQINFGDRGIQLSRRFRALRIWMSLQMLGLRAFREAVARSLDAAEEGAAYVEGHVDLEFLAPPSLGILCFRFRPPSAEPDSVALDDLNRRIQDRIVNSGRAMISSTRLRGRYALRLCVLNYRTTPGDVLQVLEAIVQEGRGLVGNGLMGNGREGGASGSGSRGAQA